MLDPWPDLGRPLVVAHRGASGYAPENTFASFALGLEQGADLLELDVHLSRDGEPVVIHDEALDRTTDGRGLVVEHTVAELRQFDAGAWFGPQFAGQRIPTLDEVLAWARGRICLALEIKNAPSFYPGIEAKIAALLDRHDMLRRTLVISFDHPALRRLGGLAPGLLTGALYACRPVDQVDLAHAAGARVLAPAWSFVTPRSMSPPRTRPAYASTPGRPRTRPCCVA